MICEKCAGWCARTPAALMVRVRNIQYAAKRHDPIKPRECPQCGGIEWATSAALVDWDSPRTPQELQRKRSMLVLIVAASLGAATTCALTAVAIFLAIWWTP